MGLPSTSVGAGGFSAFTRALRESIKSAIRNATVFLAHRSPKGEGGWRPIIGKTVEKFLECGDLAQGFARVRCPDCAHEFFLGYSCRGRCFCPSCHPKRALQTAFRAPQEVCAPVKEAEIKHWDPDCFLIGDTYYAFSGGRNPPLLKSKDLKNWIHVGDFFSHEPDNVAIGEVVSCGNFFPIGDKWMLLCISHPYGCRYYLADWDAEAEQFVPETHGRMNWRSDDQDSDSPKEYRDFFAPESLLTEDGRRVMWAWLRTLTTTPFVVRPFNPCRGN